MRKRKIRTSSLCTAMLATALVTLGFVSSASAYSGVWSKFNYCPVTNPETFKCLNSLTTGGKVVLGKKTVPIVNDVTLQGGVTEATEVGEEYFSHLVAATNGQTLSKSPQPVPGGLLGLVPPEGSPLLIRVLVEAAAENGLTGVNATLELAKPANQILISEVNLAFEEGIALKLPVKIHLENPTLGSNCYVGSSTSPLIWNLTTGVTAPPAGTAPIRGFGGQLEFYEEAQLAEIANSELVDNTWSAPGVHGCGGLLLEGLMNPIINSQVGLPSPAGANVAILEADSFIALAEAVVQHP